MKNAFLFVQQAGLYFGPLFHHKQPAKDIHVHNVDRVNIDLNAELKHEKEKVARLTSPELMQYDHGEIHFHLR